MLLKSRELYVTNNQKIDYKKKMIERYEKSIITIQNKNSWTHVLIRPIMEAVKDKFPTLTWDDERLVPMGLRCAVSVFGHDENDETVCVITFTPTDLKNGIISFDNGEKRSEYSSNSIGGSNGFDNISEPIFRIEQIFEHVESQAFKNELTELR